MFVKNFILIICIMNNYVTFADHTPMPQPRTLAVDKYPLPYKESQKIPNEQEKKKTNKSYDPKDRVFNKTNALCHAIADKDLQEVDKMLADKEVDVNERCISFNGTPLITAIEVDNLEMVDRIANVPGIILTSTGDESEISNWQVEGTGITPLMVAADYSNYDIVKCLILNAKKNGQDIGINLQNKLGRTALFYASSQGNIDIVQLLLAEGADPLITDHKGKKASDYTTNPAILELLLMHTIDFNHYEIAKFLILTAKNKKQDTGINLQNRLGWSALFYASSWGEMDTVRLLLAKGADPLLTDNKGRKASDYTKNPEILELLLNAEKERLARTHDTITFKQEFVNEK